MANPLLDWERLPPFNIINETHIPAAFQQLLAAGEDLVSGLEADPPRTWAGLVEPLQDLQDRVQRLQSVVNQINAMRNTPEWRVARQKAIPHMVAFNSRLQQSAPIYHALCALRDDPRAKLSDTQRRILDKSILRAELIGVQLPEAEQLRLNVLILESNALRLAFADNVLDSTKAWSLLLTDPSRVAGMPPHWRTIAAGKACKDGHDGADADRGPWLVTLDTPSARAVLKHASDRSLRETVYNTLVHVASAEPNDNTPLLRRILEIRRESAAILGYEDFAQQILTDRMASSVDEIEDLMQSLLEHARPAAIQDHAHLSAIAAKAGHPLPLKPWDISYWTEIDREDRFSIREDEIRPYFSIDNVLTALFTVSEELFQVRFVPASPDTQTWHPDVRVYDVYPADGDTLISSFFLDPYARPENKRRGGWMSAMVNRTPTRCAVAVIASNLTPPTASTPSLIGLRGAQTLFHELGHALQHMLTEVDEVSAAGIRNVEWDAVELPSTFMENWLYHRPVLRQIARHHETGASIGEEMLDKLIAARRYHAGSRLVGQISQTLQDLRIHSASLQDADPIEAAWAVHRSVSVLSLPDPDRRLCSFQHIFSGGYAAGYYSYLWAEVLSTDAFSVFEQDIDNPEARKRLGQRFRETVLARGGSQHPMQVFMDFRGRAPGPEALLRSHGLLGASH
jgi:oligopeptidase A